MAQVQRTVRVRLVRVIDGDSVQVRPAGLLLWLLGAIMDGHIECRLYGIDAPELGQDLGPRARDELVKADEGTSYLDGRHGRRPVRAHGRSLLSGQAQSIRFGQP